MDKTATEKNNVFFFEDFSYKDLNENKVGRKGLSLFRLKDMDVPVPEFFVISADNFIDFCYPALEKNAKALLLKGRNPETEDIEKVLLREDFEEDVQRDLLSAYTRLSGFTDAWVSVRSSVVFPQNEEISFSGVFSTELNVRKFDDLKDAVKRVYSSMFCDDVVAYASKMGIDLADVKLAVVVQKMVQSEVSGVVFTTDPITQDDSKLSVEAVFGLGDVISLGEITPDSYLLNKRDLSVLEKHIAPQEWMKVRTSRSGNKSNRNVEKIKISNNWSHRQKISDKDIAEVAKIALIVENKSRQIQNLEWVLSNGRFWILQNKPLYESMVQVRVTPLGEDFTRDTVRDLVKAFIENYKGQRMIVDQAVSDAQRMMKRSSSNEAAMNVERLILSAKRESDNESSSNVKQEDFVVSGIGASFGNTVGRILVLDTPTLVKVTKKDVLLIKKYSSEMESMIIASGGVIMDTGGITSDTAILCREFGIPAILGATSASTLLKTGDYVEIDGNSGTIYRVVKNVQSDEGVHPVVDAYSKENLTGVDLLHKEEEEKPEEILESEKLPPRDATLPPSATKVFTMTNMKPEKLFDYVGNSHGIVYVDLDKIMIEDGRHVMAYVEEKKFVDYTKSICEKILEYVELAHGDEVVVTIGSQQVKEFRDLTKGSQYEEKSLPDEAYGTTHYIANTDMLRRVVKIVKRVRNVYKKRNVSIAIHSPMSGDAMKEFKKQLMAEKLKRSSTFKIYAVLDNPAEIIMADEIVSTKIDGLILNMPRIARQMQGFRLDDPKAKYDLSRNSVFKVLDSVVDVVKSQTENVIVIVENSKPLLKYAVQLGVYGISVFAEDIVEARKTVSDEESKLILGS